MSSDSDDGSGTFKQFVEQYSEEELATILIIVGFVLFFIPILNVVGGFMILIGAITWFSDWLWG
jgi:uncharacterized membrane protein YphA (DoxX/SURF4 family)